MYPHTIPSHPHTLTLTHTHTPSYPHTLHPPPSHSTVQKGSLLIDSSTIEMAVVKQVAAKATDVGTNFIDAPVSGGKR